MPDNNLNELLESLPEKKREYYLKRKETLLKRGITKEEFVLELIKKEIDGKIGGEKRLPAGMYDKMNYMCRVYMDRTARMSLTYDFVPETESLKNSLLCLFECSAVMHSRFVDNHINPYWKVCDYNIDDIFETREVENLKESQYEFLKKPISIDSHVQCFMALYTKGDSSILCFKFNHMVMDGVGCGQFIMDIIFNYERFIKEDYSNIDYRTGPRRYTRIYEDMPKEKAKKAKKQFANSSPREKHSLPYTPSSKDDRTLLIEKEIPAEIFEKARLKGKEQGATANDVIAAAYIRAFYKIAKLDPKEKLHVSCAVDLRRYLKDINSIGYTNHTTFMLCSVDSMGETMDDTVKMARDSTNKAKTDEFLGLHGLPLLNIAYKTMVYAQAELVVKLFYNNANLAISNVGTIAGRLYVMDGHAPLAAFGSGGAKRKPSGFTTTQSIGGRLNLIMAVIGNDEDEKMVIRFFDMIEEEMKEYIA